MLELLNQLDGFDTRGDVKVIMATNRIESLDPALIRPGRIDRKIEFPLPDVKTKRHIFRFVLLYAALLLNLSQGFCPGYIRRE
jgi:26S proteasome regulatory subunit T2